MGYSVEGGTLVVEPLAEHGSIGDAICRADAAEGPSALTP